MTLTKSTKGDNTMEATRIQLDAADIPTHWYNVAADLPSPLAPPLGPDGTFSANSMRPSWVGGRGRGRRSGR